MKKSLIAFLIIGGISSCDLLIPSRWIDDDEPERFAFTLKNSSKSIYEDVVIYAIDSNQFHADSSFQQGIGSGGIFVVTIDIPKLSYISNGVFEIKTTLNGKVLTQRFGSINKPTKSQEFKVEFMDSSIFIK